jgi:hypothetical protein
MTMANILDLRTIGNQTIYVVDAIPGAAAGTAAFTSSLALYPDQVAATGSFTVVDYTLAAGITLTVGSTALVEGAAWNVGATNDATATAIAAAITSALGVTAVAVGPKVNITAIVGLPAPLGPEGNSIAIVSSAPAAVSASGATLAGGSEIGRLYCKFGPADTAWNEIATNGTYVNEGDYRRIALYSDSPSGTAVDDQIIQNAKTIDLIVAAQSSRSANITYTVPNPGNAITSADFVLTEGNQTIYGNKTFGTMARPADTVMYGTLQVDGTLTYVNTVDLQVADKNILINKGGAAASAGGAGLDIEENSVVTGYIKVNATRDGFLLKAPAALGYGEFLYSALTADRSYTWQDRNGYVALQTPAIGVDKQLAFYNASFILDCEAGSAANAITWDYSTNRLGIATASPQRTLDVAGSAIVHGALRIEAPTTLVNYEIMQAQKLTTDASVQAINTIATAADTVMLVEARVIAKCTGGSAGVVGDCASYIRTFRVKRVGGTVTILNVDSMYTSEDKTLWNVTVTLSGTNVLVNVVGVANNNITWDSTVIVQAL